MFGQSKPFLKRCTEIDSGPEPICCALLSNISKSEKGTGQPRRSVAGTTSTDSTGSKRLVPE